MPLASGRIRSVPSPLLTPTFPPWSSPLTQLALAHRLLAPTTACCNACYFCLTVAFLVPLQPNTSRKVGEKTHYFALTSPFRLEFSLRALCVFGLISGLSSHARQVATTSPGPLPKTAPVLFRPGAHHSGASRLDVRQTVHVASYFVQGYLYCTIFLFLNIFLLLHLFVRFCDASCI